MDKKRFINGLKYAQHKTFCVCKEVYKIYEGDDNENSMVCITKSQNRIL